MTQSVPFLLTKEFPHHVHANHLGKILLLLSDHLVPPGLCPRQQENGDLYRLSWWPPPEELYVLKAGKPKASAQRFLLQLRALELGLVSSLIVVHFVSYCW